MIDFPEQSHKRLFHTRPHGNPKSNLPAIFALATLLLLVCSSLMSSTATGEQTAGYTIYIENSTVKAVNGVTGAVDYSGSNGATVIQSTINALTNGGKVLIKAGTYLISTTITPATPTIRKLSSTDWPIRPPSYTIYIENSTVKAVNGVTGAVDYSGSNGATVIQSTINALTNGGKVLIKAGTYLISTTINPTASTIHDIELCGEGPETILYLANGVSGKVISLSHENNWYIHHLQINGNRGNQDQSQSVENTRKKSQACDGIDIAYGMNILIEDCYIHDCRCFGINAYGVTNVQVHRCRMENNDANHINFATCDNSMATENIVDGSSDVAITTLSGRNTIFANNTIRNCNLNTSPFSSNTHKGLCAEACERPVDNTLFEGNDIYSCGVGIVSDPNPPFSASRLSIKGNRIHSCDDGIKLVGVTTGCFVERNFIYSSSRDGIRVDAPTVTMLQIVGNYVSDSTRNGIYNHSDNALIVGNKVCSSSGAGIYTNRHMQVLVAFNTIDTVGYASEFAKDGVSMDDGCSSCLILGNQIASSAQDGVRVSGSGGNGAANNLIAWNTIASARNNGVSLLGSASTGNEITGNLISNIGNTPIYDGGTNTIITDNTVLVPTTSSTTSVFTSTTRATTTLSTFQSTVTTTPATISHPTTTALTSEYSTTTTVTTSTSATSQRTTSVTRTSRRTTSVTETSTTTKTVTTRITTSTKHPSPITTKITKSPFGNNDVRYDDFDRIMNHNLI